MIKTKQDLRYYIEQDRIAYGKEVTHGVVKHIKRWIFPDSNYEYMVSLRKYEYHSNTRGGVHRILVWYYALKLAKWRTKSGIELSPNVAGAGLHISHGKVVVSSIAQIGEHCKILSDVTIGGQGSYNQSGAPRIGNNVFIGTGAKIIGNITIADDVVIGANSVVTKDVLEPDITVAGIPARKISDTGSYRYLHRE